MLKFSLMTMLALTLAAQAQAKTIRDICHDSHAPEPMARTSDDLKKAVCRFSSMSGTPEQAKELTGQVIAAIQKAEQQPGGLKSWKDNKELGAQLGALSETAEDDAAVQQRGQDSSLRNALIDLNAKYDPYEERLKHQDAYFNALKAVIAQTKSGPRVIDCFYKSDDPKIVTGGVQLMPNKVAAPVPGQGTMMMFQLSNLKDGRHAKNILLDVQASPILAVHALAHEFQHSCAAREKVMLAQEKSPGAADKLQQFRVIDEMRAYKFQGEFYKEIAAAAPKLVCSASIVSNSYGTIPMREFDWVSTNAEDVENGTFPSHLIEVYMGVGAYKSRDLFYQKAPAGDPTKFRDDFMQRVRTEGFQISNE